MEMYRTNTQDGQSGIEKYLEGVYGRYDCNMEAAARRSEAFLGIPVTADDVDLILACEALAAEQSEYAARTHAGTGFRIKTQAFRDSIAQMRVDTDWPYMQQSRGVLWAGPLEPHR